MKRVFASLTVLLGSLLTTYAQFPGSGTGTENDPYLIYNENQLSSMAGSLNQEGVVFKLMKDLDITDWIAVNNPSQGWRPIGVESSPFKGIFYGNNHTISGFIITRNTESNVGFFGYLNGAIVQDLTLEGTQVSGANYVGGLVGQALNSTISNVTIRLTDGTGVNGTDYIGGFAGKLTGTTLTDCNVEVTGGVNGSQYVGGFAGNVITSSTINGFSVEADVSGSSRVGGMIGAADGGNYEDGTAVGNVTATNGTAGGFAGSASNYELDDITVEGNITAQGTDCRAGGMVAVSDGTTSLANCTYKGNVTGTQMVGGIVGELVGGSSQTFTSCFSKGKLTNDGDYTGGVVGVSHGACIAGMESCSHFGDINGKQYVGGLIGGMLSADIQPTLYTYKVWEGYSVNGNSRTPCGTCRQTVNETIDNGSKVNVSINNCTAIGNIDGTSWIGGLIGVDLSSYGYSPNAKTSTCNDYGSRHLFKNDIYTGYSSYYSDNLTYNHSYTRNSVSHSLTNNYYSGTINGTNYVGGLVGQKGGGELKNNYSYANIYGNQNVGGIVGATTAQMVNNSYNTTTLKSNVAICSTVSATVSNIGRVYGSIDNHTVIGALGSAEGNLSLAQTRIILSGVVQEVEDNEKNGNSIGPVMLRLKSTYVPMGWDFDNDWNSLDTECYPYKKYQAAPPVIESNLVSQATSISGNSIDGGTVYLYYKDREAVSTQCEGHEWTFNTEALQSGAQVQIYADVDGLTPSYFTTTTVGYPGSGTETDPWRIYTAEDLQGASNRGYYKVMNDIDLSAWISENSPVKGWPAIGRNSGEATFIDGDGHKVTGLWTNTTDNYTGLFSNFSAGQIKNLNVEVATGKKVIGGDYTGILIGRNANGRIVNCSVKGDVEGTLHVGGVVGYVETSIVNVVDFDGSVTSTADDAYVGGIAGQMQGCTVSSCRNTSIISASGNNNRVGGLTGDSREGTITKSIINTTLTSTGTENYVGGLVGYSETPITMSVSSGSASATGSDSYSGGLVGYALSPISDSYSTASATGTQFTAGLVGYTFSTIDKCYAKGNVYGVMYGGGLVGELDGENASLTNSVACNNILSLSAQSSWGSRVIGGFKNGAAEPNQTNYALSTMQVSLNNVPKTKTDDSVEGIAKTEAQLMASNTYLGIDWDLSEVWGIDEGQMYPFLLWEIDINPVADVSFDKTNLLIAAGKTETITPSVLPLGATNKRLEWTSTNTNVATVDDGVVTAVAVGTATITATTTDGSNLSATCNVTVTANKDAAIAELQSIVASAQALYDNSTEGENIGDYVAGSRAQLLAVINSVNAQISSTMSDEALTQCTNDINNAITTFQNGRVTAGDDTDVSQIANTIYLERVETAAGSQIQLSVKMKNTVEVRAYQFDLYLPDGVTVATDEDDFALAELSTVRTTKKKTDYFGTSVTSDGSFRVLCGSSQNYTFSGNDGEVAIITLNIAADIAEGEHPIILKNVKLTDNSPTPNLYTTDYLKSTLIISSYTLGDVNADGSIDVADFIGVANYILGNAPTSFIEKAADVNSDNSIDVADFIGIANMILNQANASRSFEMMARGTRRQTPTDIDNLNDVIYVEPVTATAGTQQVLSVKMKNTEAVAGYEFVLELPEGITVATDGEGFPIAELSTERTTASHTNYFSSTIKSDGTLKVLCGTDKQNPQTSQLYTFSGNEGEIARITVTVPANYVAGTYAVKIKDGKLADAASDKTDLPSVVETTMTVEENDGRIHFDEMASALPSYTAGTNANVTMARTIKANEWSTIVLPFTLNKAKAEAVFGTDVQLAEFGGFETVYTDDYDIIPDAIRITLTDYVMTNWKGMTGGKPFLIKTSAPISTIVVDDVPLVGAITDVSKEDQRGTSGKLTGTFVKGKIPSDGLFISNNNFYYSTGETNVKAFRCWFELGAVLDKETNFASRITFVFDDSEATGIKPINSQTLNNKTYNLSGQQVKNPAKGIYVKDGKKVIIK